MSSWLAIVAITAFAPPAALPIAAVPLDAACHASVDAAAIDALTRAMALSPLVEHGGAVYERGEGCFVFSVPVTNDDPMRVDFRVRTSASLRLAGIYHTHTTAGLGDGFSGKDVLQARASDVPSYIGVHGFNHIRKLRRGFYDYGPGELTDRTVLLRKGVKGIVLGRLAPPCRSCS
jgi:hypothetical protein